LKIIQGHNNFDNKTLIIYVKVDIHSGIRGTETCLNMKREMMIVQLKEALIRLLLVVDCIINFISSMVHSHATYRQLVLCLTNYFDFNCLISIFCGPHLLKYLRKYY